jgi:GH15 family glucan-1,4-alpha-glucosidase
MSPNDPQFIGTLDRILRTPEKGGLTSAGFVFRYDHEQTDDGMPSPVCYTLLSRFSLLIPPSSFCSLSYPNSAS